MASAPPAKQPLVQQRTGDPEVIRLPVYYFTEEPMDMVCYFCRARIRTNTSETCNPICCILGIFAMCVCVDVEHKCPNCNAVLGKCSSSWIM